VSQPFARLEQSQLLLELQWAQARDALEPAMKRRHTHAGLSGQRFDRHRLRVMGAQPADGATDARVPCPAASFARLSQAPPLRAG